MWRDALDNPSAKSPRGTLQLSGWLSKVGQPINHLMERGPRPASKLEAEGFEERFVAFWDLTLMWLRP